MMFNFEKAVEDLYDFLKTMPLDNETYETMIKKNEEIPVNTKTQERLIIDKEKVEENQKLHSQLLRKDKDEVGSAHQSQQSGHTSDKTVSQRNKISYNLQAAVFKAISNEICPMIIEVLAAPQKTRSAKEVRDLVPHAKKLEFFEERNLSDQSIGDVLALMSLKEMKKDEFILQQGETGDEFFFILEGQCEVLVPQKEDRELLEEVNQELFRLQKQLDQIVFEARKVAKYRNDLQVKRRKLNKKIPKMD